MSGALAVGIDIGGTKVAGGLVDADGHVLARARRDTPHRSTSPAVVEDTIVEVVTELLSGTADEVAAVGIGAAGFVAADRATVVFAPHLSWRDEPLEHNLQRRVPVPISVDNDANAAAWAEWRFGAAQGQSHVVMVNLGTGIGGALVLDGQIMRGRFGIAGEFGHMQVVPGGQRCECGNKGCWEQYASGNALVREARSLMTANSPMATDLLARVDGDPLALTGPMITDAARDGDTDGDRAVHRDRPLAGRRDREPGRRVRPRPVRHRRRRERGRRPAARAGAHDLPPPAHRPRLPAGGRDRGGRPRQRGGADRRCRPGPPGRGGTGPGRDAMTTLRVVSYNLKDFTQDRHAAARVIRRLDPDVLCLQEVPRRLLSAWRVSAFAAECDLVWSGGHRGSGGTTILTSLRVQVEQASHRRLRVAPWQRTRGYAVARVAVARAPAGRGRVGPPQPGRR